MDSIKEKVAVLQRLNWHLISRIAVAALIFILVVWLCISISHSSNIQEEYTAARISFGESLYGSSVRFMQKYCEAQHPGADIEGDILPNMRLCFAQMQLLNSSMADAFGSEYLIFDDETMKAIALAFDEFDAAYATGRSTEGARARMDGAVERVSRTLDERFDDMAHLK